ncbi:uncharacterized protein LOC112682360 isoform X2 [Sipha flava]|nr:uncharacterized protein LOC112682360 isoform X2 [Sipha flava]
MVDIEYETVVGEKDKPMIIVEGTKFHQQKSLANTVVKWIWSTHKTLCLKKPDADSCMEVEYSNVDNQDPEKPNLPAVLSFDKTMSLTKPEPKSCMELECLVNNGNFKCIKCK